MANNHNSRGAEALAIIDSAFAAILGSRVILHGEDRGKSVFPGYLSAAWGWSEVHMPAHMGGPQIVVDNRWGATANNSAEEMATNYGARFASIPMIEVRMGVDVSRGSDILRFSMGPIQLGNLHTNPWSIAMEIRDRYYFEGTYELRLRAICQAMLGRFTEFMDAPEEIFRLPGERLPMIAATSMLVNGRSEQSELQKWRHWLACQALQHYGDLSRLEWWHPVASTLAAGPELAARFEYEMEHAE